MQVREAIGRVVGIFLAPPAALGSFVRGARIFHADGEVFRADVRAAAKGSGARRALAERLAGPALARLSNGMHRRTPGKDPRDVLGVALRFQPGPGAVPEPGSHAQDLLLASFRHLWQLPLAPFRTDPRDFLANAYYAIAPFHAPCLGQIKIRLVPEQESPEGKDRFDRLEHAVAAGTAVLRLEVQQDEPDAPWEPLADVTLCEPAGVDQEALGFDPFRAGLGIEPVGFVQGLRWAVYPASQLGRALRRRLSSAPR